MTTQVAAPVVGTDRALGGSNATANSKFITYNYISTVATQEIFVAPFGLRLTGLSGVTRTAGSGGACTFSFYKCADGVAVGSGTLLHSGTFDVAGTADINQYLTLVAPVSSLTFNPGDRLGIELTGTATSAVGNITATFEPLF